MSPGLRKKALEGAQNARCRLNLWYWLLNFTETYDEHWQEKGTKPYAKFPNKAYLEYLFYSFQTARRLLVPKSREMMVSWAAMAYAVWKCQYYPRTHVIVQCQKETKAQDLVCGRGVPGYCRTLWERQEDFLKKLNPLSKHVNDMPADLLTWKNESIIRGVPSGADQIRQYHPSLVIFDEAAHMDEFEESWGAAEPVASQMIAVSSAAPSVFGDWCEDI